MPDAPDRTILHEDDVRDVIQDEIEDTVGATGAAIDDVVVAADETHTLNSSFSDTEVEGALNALAANVNDLASAVNDILGVLRTNGIIAES